MQVEKYDTYILIYTYTSRSINMARPTSSKKCTCMCPPVFTPHDLNAMKTPMHLEFGDVAFLKAEKDEGEFMMVQKNNQVMLIMTLGMGEFHMVTKLNCPEKCADCSIVHCSCAEWREKEHAPIDQRVCKHSKYFA